MTSDLPLEMSRLSLEYVHQAEAERFWTPSEPYRLLNGATTDPATCHRLNRHPSRGTVLGNAPLIPPGEP